MQPIKDRDIVHVILLEDGSYWVSGGFNENRDGITGYEELGVVLA